MCNVGKNNYNKKFFAKKSINEVLNLVKLNQKSFIYSIKLDLPEEIEITGNKIIFQGLLFKLLKNANQAYSFTNFQNKIVLITSKVENSTQISLSVTSGGKGLSFLEKTIKHNNILIFRDNNFDCNIRQINQTLKKEFKGKMEIISKKNKGSTLKCYFPLN